MANTQETQPTRDKYMGLNYTCELADVLGTLADAQKKQPNNNRHDWNSTKWEVACVL
ncbi:hypothetical protein FRC12_005676, partial [Ceratobasidium sp. 428]